MLSQGVSIAVAGINPQEPGSGLLIMNFTIDGDSTQKSFAYDLDDHSGPSPGFTHFTYFSIHQEKPKVGIMSHSDEVCQTRKIATILSQILSNFVKP